MSHLQQLLLQLKCKIQEKFYFSITKAKALFHPNTAHGKLNAEMTPTIPKGFHCSIKKWPGLSLGIILPLKVKNN